MHSLVAILLLFLQSLSLQQAIDLALRNNPDYRMEVTGVRIAADALKIARASQQPSVTLQDQYQYQNPVAKLSTPFGELPFTPNSTNVPLLSAQYTVYDVQLVAQTGQAQANLAASLGAEREARGVVIAAVSRAYYDLVAARRMAEVAQQVVTISAQHLRLARQRYVAGTIPRAEVLQAQTDLSQRRVEAIDAGNAAVIAQSSLDAAMSVSLDNVYALSDSIDQSAPRIVLASMLESAKQSRGELLASQQAIAAAQFALRAAHAGYTPRLNVAVSEGNVQPPVTPGFRAQFSVGILAVWRLLDGGQTAAQIDAAQASLEQAQYALQRQSTAVELAVREAYLNVSAAEQRVAAAQSTAAYANESQRLAEIRYRGGVGTALELRDAELRDLSARQQVITAQTAVRRSLVDLRFASGLL